MKRYYIIDSVLYWIFIGLRSFLKLFPFRLALLFGGSFLYLFGLFYHHRQEIAYENIKRVFPNLKPSSIQHILKKSIFYLGVSFVEFLLSPKFDKDYVNNFVTCHNISKIDKALDKGKGVIFLTAHYGNWELLSLIGAILGYPSVVLARRQKFYKLNRLLNEYRTRKGCIVVEKGFSTRELFKALKTNKCIGILADQNPGKSGVLTKFFTNFVPTPRGFFEIAERCNATILPVFLKRKNIFYHELIIHDEFDLKKEKEKNFYIYNKLLQYYISNSPQQWLWFHKRWKYSPNQSILILSDGKAGHYRQSNNVARILKEELWKKSLKTWPRLEKKSINDYIKLDYVEVNLKNKISRIMMQFFSFFVSKRCQGCLRCLKFLLKEDTYQKLVFKKYDYIISTGGSLAFLNIMLSIENNAKSIIILDPGFLLRKKANLVFLPQHDRKRGENIAFIKGAITDYDEATIEKYTMEFCNKYNIEKENNLYIGMLLGGNSKYYKIIKKEFEGFFSNLNDICSLKNIKFLFTTSRRTPKDIEHLAEKSFVGKSYCKLLIIANRQNLEGVVPAILGISDLIIVTSDSISMIIEAVSTGKEVIVIKLREKRKNKFSIFLNNMETAGLIKIMEINEFKTKFLKIIEKPPRRNTPYNPNEEIIRLSLRKLI
jgi:KDO2-lipid IV(A) lauroyltransferase